YVASTRGTMLSCASGVAARTSNRPDANPPSTLARPSSSSSLRLLSDITPTSTVGLKRHSAAREPGAAARAARAASTGGYGLRNGMPSSGDDDHVAALQFDVLGEVPSLDDFLVAERQGGLPRPVAAQDDDVVERGERGGSAGHAERLHH